MLACLIDYQIVLRAFRIMRTGDRFFSNRLHAFFFKKVKLRKEVGKKSAKSGKRESFHD